MNTNQKNFLKELSKLLDRYSIDEMVADELGAIQFKSNGHTLGVGSYRRSDGVFVGIITKNFEDCFEAKDYDIQR